MTRLRFVLLASLVSSRALAAGFDAEQFHPTDTANGFVSVDGAQPVRHLGFTAGAFVSWAHQTLVLRDPSGTVPPDGQLIGAQVGLDLVASFGLWNRVELGVDLPVVAYQQVDGKLLGESLSSAGLGDFRLDLKILLVQWKGDAHSIFFSAILGARTPTGNSSSFLGDPTAGFVPRLVLEWRWHPLALAVSIGAVVRGQAQLFDVTVGHQISYGWALRVSLPKAFNLLAALNGLVGVGQPGSLKPAEAPSELLLGAGWRSSFGLEVTLAGGIGLTRGYGTPDGRVLVGLRYQSPERAAKKVETKPPPVVVDSDGDGVPDERDHCPNVKGPKENSGCPDEDSDGDGLVDRLDGCPMTPGPKENFGCPPAAAPDHDKDGVPDSVDRCPEQPGSKENDGCPDVDSDGDGIVDRLDKCPFDPETFNGVDDDDGCPDQPPALADLGSDKITTKEKVQFVGTNIDPRSLKTLKAVAGLLRAHKEILKLRVEGHTDNRGSAIDNLDLSRTRAANVRRFLIENGVEARRLAAQGYGPDRPVADNKDAAGRAKNNRIELMIVERRM